MSVLICSDGVSSGSPKETSPHPYSQHLCPHLCREQRASALGLFFQLSSLSLSHIFLSSFLCSLHPRLLMTDRKQDLLLPTEAGVAEATEAPQQPLKGEENKSSPELFFSLRLREAGTLEELFPPALMYMVPVGSILPLDWLSRGTKCFHFPASHRIYYAAFRELPCRTSYRRIAHVLSVSLHFCVVQLQECSWMRLSLTFRASSQGTHMAACVSQVAARLLCIRPAVT